VALAEVTLFFAFTIGICKILYYYRHVHFLAQLMPVIVAGLFLYIPLGIMYYARRRPAEHGIALHRFGYSVTVALSVSVTILPAFVLLYSVYQQRFLHQPLRWGLDQGWYLTLVFQLLCVAFPEEVFYRGYMQSRLNQVYGKRICLGGAQCGFGLLYTAVLFALGHYLIVFQLPSLATFIPGLAFGWLREKTGGIVAPTIFHALCNGTVLFLQ